MIDFYGLVYELIFIGLVILVVYVSYLDLIKKGKTKIAALKIVCGASIGFFVLAFIFLSTEFGRHVNALAFKYLVNIHFPGAL
jgi:hypothetical protein